METLQVIRLHGANLVNNFQRPLKETKVRTDLRRVDGRVDVDLSKGEE